MFDPAHLHHDHAHRWFALNQKRGWATCPLTVNGCTRVLSSPHYPTVVATPSEVVERLREFTASPDHHFWPDSVALTEQSLFRSARFAGHQNVTDIYLLGLAVRNHGRLATFDRSIPLDAIVGARPANIVVLGER